MGVARELRGDDESEMGLIHHQEEVEAAHSVINFKIASPSANLLSLEQHKAMWEWEPSLITTTTDEPFSWLYSDVAQDSTTLPQLSSFTHKRPHSGENSTTQTSKKQCTTKSKLQQNKSSTSTNNTALPSIDPQSVAAKNRRERISERLKILQELVPNGSKVDMVTMLEKAINYVKFLQLQAKVLETDEFWPVQGGKAPDISQVKEAIDAILSSQRDSRNSSSSSKS